MNSKIAILTCISDSSVSEIIQGMNKSYCSLYGYDYILATDRILKQRSFGWEKFACIAKHIFNYDWVVYMADTVAVADYRISLERIINERSKDRDIIIARDTPYHVDTDVIFIRNSSMARKFISEMLSDETLSKWNSEVMEERWAFEVLSKGKYAGLVSFVNNRRAFNSRLSSHKVSETYSKGDFAVNCADCGDCSRIFDYITSKSRDYVSGHKKVAFTELKKENSGETERPVKPMRMRKEISVSTERVIVPDDGKSMKHDVHEVKNDTRPVCEAVGQKSADTERKVPKVSWGFKYPSTL